MNITGQSNTKSAGQLTYERDVERWPTYHDGAPRKTWCQLSEIARDSWERNPIDRNVRPRPAQTDVAVARWSE